MAGAGGPLPPRRRPRGAGALQPAGAATAVLAGGALYFLAVFAVSLLLGVARTLWLVPRLGERWAELIEIPLMRVAI